MFYRWKFTSFSVAYKGAEGRNYEFAWFTLHDIAFLKKCEGSLVVCTESDYRKLIFEKSSLLNTRFVKEFCNSRYSQYGVF